jgi:hypothetical protein
MTLQIRLLSRPREHSAAAAPSGYTVYAAKTDLPSGYCGVVSCSTSRVSPRDAIKISYCFPTSQSTNSKRSKKSFRQLAMEFNDFEEVSASLRGRELWGLPSFQSDETIGYLIM